MNIQELDRSLTFILTNLNSHLAVESPDELQQARIHLASAAGFLLSLDPTNSVVPQVLADIASGTVGDLVQIQHYVFGEAYTILNKLATESAGS